MSNIEREKREERKRRKGREERTLNISKLRCSMVDVAQPLLVRTLHHCQLFPFKNACG